jgi:hypothetical protein
MTRKKRKVELWVYDGDKTMPHSLELDEANLLALTQQVMGDDLFVDFTTTSGERRIVKRESIEEIRVAP